MPGAGVQRDAIRRHASLYSVCMSVRGFENKSTDFSAEKTPEKALFCRDSVPSAGGNMPGRSGLLRFQKQ